MKEHDTPFNWSRESRILGSTAWRLRDVTDLIRTSNLLRHRSMAAHRAATNASITLRNVIERSAEVCVGLEQWDRSRLPGGEK